MWSECRSYAVPFLIEAQRHVRTDLHHLFNEAISYYQKASENLQKVSTRFPCFTVSAAQRADNIKNKDLCDKAITYLSETKEEEIKGLGILKKIVAEL